MDDYQMTPTRSLPVWPSLTWKKHEMRFLAGSFHHLENISKNSGQDPTICHRRQWAGFS